ncbi:MAG: hypothetical protein ACRCZE_03110 [Candidatus Altimarinota bacterium]
MSEKIFKTWPELEASNQEEEKGRDSLIDVSNPHLKDCLRAMNDCFSVPIQRANLTMFLTRLLNEGESAEEIIATLKNYSEKYDSYFTYYAGNHDNERVREDARKYLNKFDSKKSSSTIKAITSEILMEANATIDPKKTDHNWPKPAVRPPSYRSPSNSAFPAVRIPGNGFRASDVADIFAEGREAAGLDPDSDKNGRGK